MIPEKAVKIITKPNAYGGVTNRIGGRSNGQSVVHVGMVGDHKTVLQHEMAHARVKRSGYRLSQIARDPARRGSEEARADFLARGGPAKSVPRGQRNAYESASRNLFKRSPEVQAYRKVQSKMTSAKQRRVSKEYSWESLRREVAKMSPDPSSVHVMSSMTGKRRGKLKKVYRP
jgi:hypothetical protein